jgi:ribokinase
VAVVGHVEWVEFAQVDHVPAPGEIVHATHTWDEPAGGGPVAAVQLAKLAGGCTLFTALGDDDLGHRVPGELARRGVRVEAVFRPTPQRRGFTFLDAAGERTITVIGERLGPNGDDPLPWHELATTDGVYFTAGDDGALRAARQARRVVATARVFDHLVQAGLPLDAVVASSKDRNEPYVPGRLDPAPGLVVLTAGAEGGSYELADGSRGRFDAAPLPGPVSDAYGAGDSFAAGLTYGLAAGLGPLEAIALAARCGAAAMTGRGPYEGQIRRA